MSDLTPANMSVSFSSSSTPSSPKTGRTVESIETASGSGLMGSSALSPSAFSSILSYGVPGPVGLVDVKRWRAVFAGLWMVKDRFAGRLRPEAREFEVMKALKVDLDLAAARVGGLAELKAERLRERAAPDRSMTPIDVLTTGFPRLQLGTCPSTDGQWIGVEEYHPAEFRLVEWAPIGGEEGEIVPSFRRETVLALTKTSQSLLRHIWKSLKTCTRHERVQLPYDGYNPRIEYSMSLLSTLAASPIGCTSQCEANAEYWKNWGRHHKSPYPRRSSMNLPSTTTNRNLLPALSPSSPAGSQTCLPDDFSCNFLGAMTLIPVFNLSSAMLVLCSHTHPQSSDCLQRILYFPPFDLPSGPFL